MSRQPPRSSILRPKEGAREGGGRGGGGGGGQEESCGKLNILGLTWRLRMCVLCVLWYINVLDSSLRFSSPPFQSLLFLYLSLSSLLFSSPPFPSILFSSIRFPSFPILSSSCYSLLFPTPPFLPWSKLLIQLCFHNQNLFQTFIRIFKPYLPSQLVIQS